MRLLPEVPEAKGSSTRPPRRRPRPPVNRDNAFFWEGVEARELRIQRCASCRELRHAPAPARDGGVQSLREDGVAAMQAADRALLG